MRTGLLGKAFKIKFNFGEEAGETEKRKRNLSGGKREDFAHKAESFGSEYGNPSPLFCQPQNFELNGLTSCGGGGGGNRQTATASWNGTLN